MTRSTPTFHGWRAMILHRPHATVEAITLQLRQLGMSAQAAWPDLPAAWHPDAQTVLFYDADMGHEGQFPWAQGAMPLPAVALIGSEAPGRLAWAIAQGTDAHLFKPVGSGGVYSALVFACEAFARRAAHREEAEALRERLAGRQVLAEATALIMVAEHLDAGAASDRLRRLAMAERKTLEAMAEALVMRGEGRVERDGRA